jgi:PAS domain S-box-containing protein
MTKIPIFTCNKDIPAELENVFDTHYPNSKLIVNIDEPEEINKALSENPEVIISKIPILNTDSTEVLNLLKRQVSQKKIPVILLADPGDNPDTLKEIIDVDSMVVLYLPFQPLELVTLISTLTKAKIAGKNKENAINDTSETNNNKQVENEEVSSNLPLMLKGIVEKSLNEIYVFDAESFKFLYANHSGLNNLGYTLEELLKLKPIDIDLEIKENEFIELIKPLRSNIKEMITYVTKLKRKNGTTYPVEVHLQQNQNIYFSIISDITDRKKIENELIARESLLNKIFDVLPVGLWVTDKHGTITRGNPAGIKIWGAAPKVPLAKYGIFKARRLPSGKEIGPDEWGLVRSINNKETIKDELLEIDSFDGQKRIILNYSAPVLDVNGDVLGAIAVNNDITALQQSEDALRISEEKFRSIVDSSPNGLYFYVLDEKDDLIFYGANPAADRIIGLDHRILTGKKLEEAFPNLTQTFIPQLYRKVAKGETYSESFELEYHDERANGFFNVTVYKTGINSIAVEFSDITASKQAEKALSESEEKHRRLFETMNQGVVYQSAEGFIISANNAAEQILGLTLDQMKGKTSMDPDWKAIYEDGRDMPGDEHPSMRALATGKKIGPIVIGIFHPISIKHIWVSIVAIPLFKPGEEKPYQVYTAFEDISQQKKANELIRKLNDELEQRVKDRTAKLEASNKELEAFAYSVSHDLRTPLRAINSFATILANDYALYLDDEARRICSVITDNSLRMGKLIDGLLNFSRLNRASLLKSQIDMNNLVTSVYSELSESLNPRQVQINVAPNLHPAFADLVLIKQVWVNLIDNALKFTSLTENPKIEISSNQEAGRIIYCVIDNGVGFNMQYINKLFDIFQRLHNEKEFKGTGIGLALVQRIVQRHGGEIWAESEPGKGAAFYFSLPEST